MQTDPALSPTLEPAPQRAQGVGRRGKIVFAIFAALSLTGIIASKAYQVLVEPDLAAAAYVGADPMDGPAPEFVFETRDGKAVKLSELRGQMVFLNFWATWCDSCRTEMPSLAVLAGRLKGQPMAMVAATVDDGWEPVDKFLAGRDFPMTILRDVDGKWAKTYGTTKFPETYLVGPDGRLLAKFVGPRDWSDKAFELYFRKALSGLPQKTAAPN